MARSKKPSKWEVVEKALYNRYPDVEFTCVVDGGLTKSVVGFTSNCCEYQERNVRSVLTTKYLCMLCVKVVAGESKVRTYDDLLLKLKSVYSGKYNYPDTNRLTYVNRKSLITVSCKKHGDFIKKAQKHLSGQGCFKCRLDEMRQDGTLCGGYSEDFFNLNPDFASLPASFYYLQVGKSFKVGITRVSVNNRIRSVRSKARMETVLIFTLSGTLYDCYCYEQELLVKYSHLRNYPKWSTEVFSEDIFNKCYPDNLNFRRLNYD